MVVIGRRRFDMQALYFAGRKSQRNRIFEPDEVGGCLIACRALRFERQLKHPDRLEKLKSVRVRKQALDYASWELPLRGEHFNRISPDFWDLRLSWVKLLMWT